MLPKYERIKEDIIAAIEAGTFIPGDKIYSEGDLKKKYGVSNTTVVKALNDLVSDGYLIRRQGEGTFVRKSLVHRRVLFSETSPTALIDKKEKATEKTLTTVIQGVYDQQIATKLKAENPQQELVKIVQVALVGGMPWKIQNRYVLAENLSEEALTRIEKGASLSAELQLRKNMASLPMEMTVGIKTLTRDSEELAPMRQVKSDFTTQLILSFFDIKKMTYDANQRPIEYTQSFIHPDYYAIEIIAE